MLEMDQGLEGISQVGFRGPSQSKGRDRSRDRGQSQNVGRFQ